MLFTKVKVTKHNPKPSVLLAKALSLFGPTGQNWITNDETRHRDDSFLYQGQILNVIDVTYKIRELLDDNPSDIATISKEFKLLAGADTFCAIGAIHQINSKHQELAEMYLASAISIDYRKHINVHHDDNDDNCPCADCISIDDAASIITSNNDDLSDEPEERAASYKVIKGWFTTAIALAKADGN